MQMKAIMKCHFFLTHWIEKLKCIMHPYIAGEYELLEIGMGNAK